MEKLVNGKLVTLSLEDIQRRDRDTAPPPVDLFKEQALYRIKSTHADRLDKFTGSASQEERDTWPIQKEQAELYLDNLDDEPLATAEFLRALLTTKEKAYADANSQSYAKTMADIIMKKSDYVMKVIATFGQVKRTAEDAIESAQTVEEVRAAMSAWEVADQEAVTELDAEASNNNG